MSTGETIQCRDLDDAIRRREKLMNEGYGVDFEYERNKKAVLTITEEPKE